MLDLSAGVEMLVGPGEKVEKGQVVYPFIKDQPSKSDVSLTTDNTVIIKTRRQSGEGPGRLRSKINNPYGQHDQQHNSPTP